jgi:ATP-binding cassette subfamily B protein
MMPVMQGIGDLGYVAIALLGGALAAAGSIAVGDIQAFIQYIRNFMHPLAQVAQVSNMLQSTVAAAERVFEFLAGEEEHDAVTSSDPARFEGNVEFDHVRFGYDPQVPVIRDFSVSVSKGMKVAIVGPTGAGKTTLVKLLMRFYDLQGGTIRIDGHDIAHVPGAMSAPVLPWYSRTRGFSRHDPGKHPYGRLDASDEDVARAQHRQRGSTTSSTPLPTGMTR